MTAVPDTAATVPATPVTTDVLGNDTVSTAGAPLDPATVTVPTGPTHGTTTVNADGSIEYTPDAGFSGVDSYRYQVCDSSAPTPVCGTATVTISVVNAVAPVEDVATAAQNSPVTTDVLANDVTSPGGAALDPGSVTVATGPAHGTATAHAGGTITYSPDTDYSGPDSYTYRVCDTSAPTPVCATATVDLTVAANVVTAAPDTETTPPGAPVTTNVLGNDSVGTGGAPLDPASVTVPTGPAHGTTKVNPNGTIEYAPDAGFSGADTYTYRVCDTSTPTPVCDTAAVTVTVVNVVAASNVAVNTPQNTPLTTDVLVNDTVSVGGAPLDPGSVTVESGPSHGTTVERYGFSAALKRCCPAV